MCVSGNGSENFRQGRHTHFSKKNNLMPFERHFAFQNASNYLKPENLKMHQIIFFPENQENILRFISKFR